MLNKEKLEADLKVIADLIREVAAENGGIYISATHCKCSTFTWVTYQREDGSFKDVIGGAI